ncbi:MAG: hypothetical protein IJ061_03410 [Lachnospiraceae bacterium]|nr:hypothetical protein [Lachnospiraceae bacterium]
MVPPVRAVCEEYDCRELCFTTYEIGGYAMTVCSKSREFTDRYEMLRL